MLTDQRALRMICLCPSMVGFQAHAALTSFYVGSGD